MLLAGHTLGTPDQSLQEALSLFAAAGLDGAEVIYQNDYPSGLPVGDPVAADRARQFAHDAGIRIIGLTPYTTGLNALGREERAAALDELRAAIDTAQRVGARTIRVYAGSWHDGDQQEDVAWGHLVEGLAGLAPLAAQAGAVLCVENHFGTMTRTAEATARLVRQVDHEAVRVLYDQANLVFTHDEDMDAAFEVQGDLVAHVHVKDLVFTDPSRPFQAAATARVDQGERYVRSRVVGEGVVPWPAILAELVRRGYDGALSLEYEYRWHRQDLPDPAEGFARSAAYLRGLLAELER